MTKHFPRQIPQLRGKLRAAARQMRHSPTPAEDFLWQRLRDRQLARQKFHRQYAIDRFVVDFFCSSAALIVEVDGDIHRQQVEADQEREQMLATLGFRVVRFTNTQVMEQTRCCKKFGRRSKAPLLPNRQSPILEKGMGDEDFPPKSKISFETETHPPSIPD